MPFSKISIMVGSGPGIAPLYETFGPIKREKLTQSDVKWIDTTLEDSGFKEMESTDITKWARDMVFTSLTVEYEDGVLHTVKFVRNEIPEKLDQLIKFVQSQSMELAGEG